MANTSALIDALKGALKTHGLTYADVAANLGLSQASVKRMFSEKHFTLKRLEDICQMMDLEFSGLVRIAEGQEKYISQLTEEQEQLFVSDIKLLIISVCLLNKWSFEEILETYQISQTEGIQLLAQLDRMKIIELLPNNRVKPLISRNFSWIPNGPIQKYFFQQVQHDFFTSNFRNPGEKLIFQPGMISKGSNSSLIKKLEKLAAEFNELHEEDSNLPLNERFGTAIVLAIRPWELRLFTEHRKAKKKEF